MQLEKREIETLGAIAREAGKRILPYFRKEHGLRKKADHSPVTDADMAAHDFILEALRKEFPEIPIVSEEDSASPSLLKNALFFLVDPLDGTRSFVRGEDEFTVNIGLVEHQKPVYGVLYAPVKDVIYTGGYRQAFRNGAPICCRKIPEKLIVTRSRSHASPRTQAWLDTLPIEEIKPASSAIKFGWVAEGSADIYPRFGRTMEWDTAAGHAIVEAAGGTVTQEDGSPLLYGKSGFENPAFIARGAP